MIEFFDFKIKKEAKNDASLFLKLTSGKELESIEHPKILFATYYPWLVYSDCCLFQKVDKPI